MTDIEETRTIEDWLRRRREIETHDVDATAWERLRQDLLGTRPDRRDQDTARSLMACDDRR